MSESDDFRDGMQIGFNRAVITIANAMQEFARIPVNHENKNYGYLAHLIETYLRVNDPQAAPLTEEMN